MAAARRGQGGEAQRQEGLRQRLILYLFLQIVFIILCQGTVIGLCETRVLSSPFHPLRHTKTVTSSSVFHLEEVTVVRIYNSCRLARLPRQIVPQLPYPPCSPTCWHWVCLHIKERCLNY